ncbi:hypothetical protein HYFRA_00013064 [Hymenoscyphus fraxineus]|uniref:MFS general substrate transporter n=1 Tax=Hymenoscyphus fraxineus TaxID=746836 RepID=A0A9N9L4G2_9HELO|nr:hypothetical protein HYFRA_00013064 [Hymenoscyphus fraxineus]
MKSSPPASGNPPCDFEEAPHIHVADSVCSMESSPDISGNDSSISSSGIQNDGEGMVEKNLLPGVAQAEAVTRIWNKNTLFVAYGCIFLVYCINSLQFQVQLALNPYVASAFNSHALTSVVIVESYILSGILQPPMSKILDYWGRAEGLVVIVSISALGNALTAVCKNVPGYVVAQSFTNVGFQGLMYVLSVIVADTTSLANRAFAFAFAQCPFIFTAFAGPALAQSFYSKAGFRWVFGCFAIIMPTVSLPIIGLLFYHQRKAKRLGILTKIRSGRSTLKSIKHFAVEFDVTGTFLIFVGLSLFLLPFSLTGPELYKWTSPAILGMIIPGIGFLVAFGLWEQFGASTPYLPGNILLMPSVIGAALTCIGSFGAYYCWDNYFTSFLQVMKGVDIQQAGFIGNIPNLANSSCGLIVGYLVRVSGRFKWLGWAVMPLQFAGGIMISIFTRSDSKLAYLIISQILVSLGGGTLYVCGEMAAMAVAGHDGMAAVLAFQNLCMALGVSLGGAFAGAIWSNTIPGQLMKFLPDDAKKDVAKIYGNLELQLSFDFGHPVRTALVNSYSVAQFRLGVAGTCILLITLVGVALWRDVHVKKLKQMGGVVL